MALTNGDHTTHQANSAHQIAVLRLEEAKGNRAITKATHRPAQEPPSKWLARVTRHAGISCLQYLLAFRGGDVKEDRLPIMATMMYFLGGGPFTNPASLPKKAWDSMTAEAAKRTDRRSSAAHHHFSK